MTAPGSPARRATFLRTKGLLVKRRTERMSGNTCILSANSTKEPGPARTRFLMLFGLMSSPTTKLPESLRAPIKPKSSGLPLSLMRYVFMSSRKTATRSNKVLAISSAASLSNPKTPFVKSSTTTLLTVVSNRVFIAPEPAAVGSANTRMTSFIKSLPSPCVKSKPIVFR